MNSLHHIGLSYCYYPWFRVLRHMKKKAMGRLPPTDLVWRRNHIVFPETRRHSRGVTKVIKRWFAPKFRFRNIKNRPTTVGGLPFRQARRRGKLLDRQMVAYAKSKNIPLKACEETRRLIDYLSEQRLTVVSAQQVVGWSQARLGTCIDLVCTNHLQEYIIVELKRGCAYRKCHTGERLAFVQAENDSLFNQHQIQLLISKILFQKTFNIDAKLLLLYIDNEQVLPYDESTFTVKWTESASQILLKSAEMK